MPISVSELGSPTERLSSGEAVALVLAAINAWERAGRAPEHLPSPDGFVLGSDGTVSLCRPLCGGATEDAASFFAMLLRRLLPVGREDTPDRPAVPVPGALLLLVARASGDSELPRATLAGFRHELARFQTLDRNDLALVYARVMPPRHGREIGRRTLPLYRRVVTRRGAIAASLALLIVAGYTSAIWIAGTRPTAPVGGDRVTIGITDEPANVVYESDAIGSSAPARSTQLQPGAAQNPLAPRPLLPASLVGADVFSPSFARNGQTVLFHAGRRQSALMQATFDPDGPPVITAVVRDGAANYHGTISPDGEWLAFDSDRDGIRGVYVSRVTGRDARKVSGDGYASVPTWAPDARYLAFAKAETARPRVWNVWVVDVRTGNVAPSEPPPRRTGLGGVLVSRRDSRRLQCRRHTRRRESRGWSATDVSCAAGITADSNTCRIARRRPHHLSAVRRRCLGARSGDRPHATGAGRRVGRGVCLVTRRQPRPLPREAGPGVVGLGTANDPRYSRLRTRLLTSGDRRLSDRRHHRGDWRLRRLGR